MKRGTSRRSAVVADRRPLERNLARFLLEERGFAVAAEAATAADTTRAVQEHRPDVVLVHEDVATERAGSILPTMPEAAGTKPENAASLPVSAVSEMSTSKAHVSSPFLLTHMVVPWVDGSASPSFS